MNQTSEFDQDSFYVNLVLSSLKDGFEKHGILCLINIRAVKNFNISGLNFELNDNLIHGISEKYTGFYFFHFLRYDIFKYALNFNSKIFSDPLMIVLLILKKGNETSPVNLDLVAVNLQNDGFTIDKIVKDDQTQLINFDMNSIQNVSKADFIEKIIKDAKKKKFETEYEDDFVEKSTKRRTKTFIKVGKLKTINNLFES